MEEICGIGISNAVSVGVVQGFAIIVSPYKKGTTNLQDNLHEFTQKRSNRRKENS